MSDDMPARAEGIRLLATYVREGTPPPSAGQHVGDFVVSIAIHRLADALDRIASEVAE